MANKDNNKEGFSKMSINWFPGHMVKAQNEIKNNLKLIDVVVEILDARVPIASHNKLMDELAKDKTYEFCFMLASNKIKGATGMFIRPLAIC